MQILIFLCLSLFYAIYFMNYKNCICLAFCLQRCTEFSVKFIDEMKYHFYWNFSSISWQKSIWWTKKFLPKFGLKLSIYKFIAFEICWKACIAISFVLLYSLLNLLFFKYNKIIYASRNLQDHYQGLTRNINCGKSL